MHFSRNKLIGVQQTDDRTLLVHGVLEDNIYAMDLDVEIGLPELEIKAVQGRMKRYTTALCTQAVDRLPNAVGLRIGPDLTRQVNRVIGREGCRHFANLLLECCRAVRAILLEEDRRQQGTALGRIEESGSIRP